MDEPEPAWWILAIVVLSLTAFHLVALGLKPKPFVWPAAWCWNEDASLSAPCVHLPRQQDI